MMFIKMQKTLMRSCSMSYTFLKSQLRYIEKVNIFKES